MIPSLLAGIALAATTRDLVVTLAPPGGSPRDIDRWTADISAARARALACIRPLAELRPYYATPLLFVRLDAAAERRAAQCPGVLGLAPSRELSFDLAESLPLVGADVAAATYGLAGWGTAVAVIDTGVDYALAELGGCFGGGCKVVWGYDFGDGDGDPADCHGHGSNVAAIAAGTGGVAPGADIVAYKVFETANCTTTTDDAIAAAIDDAVLNAATLGIVAINLSLGTEGYTTSSSCDGTGSATETAADTAFAAGIVLVAAAGNDGEAEAVSFPACLRRVLAVANSYDGAAGSSSYCTDRACSGYCTDSAPVVDSLNCSSNGGRLVDLAAPGSTITAGGQSMAGTSQASPHVAGAALLLAERVPGAEPGDVADWLARSGVSITDTRSGSAYTYPRLDLPTVLAGSGADLVVSDVRVDGDSLVEWGEAEGILVEVRNSGPGDVAGAEVLVSTTDPELLFDGVPVALPTLIVGGTVAAPAVPFSVASSCSTDHAAEVTVSVVTAGEVVSEGVTLAVYCVVDDDDDGATRELDCDDSEAAAYPGGIETCDGIDNDCDGVVDSPLPADAPTWYADADGDGHGDALTGVAACAAESGRVATAGDCDDGDGTVFPGAADPCDGVDNDCSGVVDDGAVCDSGEVVAEEKPAGRGQPTACGCAAVRPGGVLPLLAVLALRRRKSR